MHAPPKKPDPVTPRILLRAYAVGLFPMGEDEGDDHLHWFDPHERGIFPLDGLIVSKSLAKRLRAAPFQITADKDFEGVLARCAESWPGREKTWINGRIANLFRELFALGFAHSIEAWRDGDLVGGLYGLAMGGAFSGESMFHRATDASKLCLVHLGRGRIAAAIACLTRNSSRRIWKALALSRFSATPTGRGSSRRC